MLGNPFFMISRDDRIKELLKALDAAEPAGNGLLAYKLISTTLNEIEDRHLGETSWNPPRRFGEGTISPRLYPSYPDSMHHVEGWPGVTMIVHHKQLVFIEMRGAFQVQTRTDSNVHFSRRGDLVLLDKPDRWGFYVWDRKPTEI